LVDTTVPVRIRPRIETRPVKGHFLSMHRRRLVLDQQQTHNSELKECLIVSSESDECELKTPKSQNTHLQPLSVKRPALQHTNICPFDSGLRRSKPQTNIFVPSSSTLTNSLLSGLCFRIEKDVRLLLEGAFRLHRQFGRHVYRVGGESGLLFDFPDDAAKLRGLLRAATLLLSERKLRTHYHVQLAKGSSPVSANRPKM